MKTAHLYLFNELTELEKLRSFLEETLTAWGVADSTVHSLNLVLEEAFVNIISYAFRDENRHEIGFLFQLNETELVISVTDDGLPFDPTAQEPPDVRLPAEDRSIGGLGIFLIREMMDTVRYQRRDSLNELILTKQISI